MTAEVSYFNGQLNKCNYSVSPRNEKSVDETWEESLCFCTFSTKLGEVRFNCSVKSRKQIGNVLENKSEMCCFVICFEGGFTVLYSSVNTHILKIRNFPGKLEGYPDIQAILECVWD